jgi:protein-tyrosine phosphatase
MTEYELYIGDARDASDHEKIENREVDSVLKLTHNGPQDGYPNSVDVHDFGMRDGPQNDRETFRKAVSRLLGLFQDGETVFVHCNAGSSRSPTVSAAALALHEGVEFESALETIRESRNIRPHQALLDRGRAVVGELR